MDTQHTRAPNYKAPSLWETGSNWQWFVLICLLYAYSTYMHQAFVISDALFYNSYGEQLAFERIEQMLNVQAKLSWVSYVFIPFFVGIKLLLVSLCLVGGSIWDSLKVGFRRIWSIVLRAELIFALGSVCTVLFLTFFVELSTIEDLQGFHHFSLKGLFPFEDLNAWYLYPLQVVSLFEILYVIFLVKGMQALSGKGAYVMLELVGKSYGLGLLIWVLLVIFLKLNLGL